MGTRTRWRTLASTTENRGGWERVRAVKEAVAGLSVNSSHTALAAGGQAESCGLARLLQSAELLLAAAFPNSPWWPRWYAIRVLYFNWVRLDGR